MLLLNRPSIAFVLRPNGISVEVFPSIPIPATFSTCPKIYSSARGCGSWMQFSICLVD